MPALTQATSRFLAWWGRELAATVPQGLRRWWLESDRIILLSILNGRAVFERPMGDKLQEIMVVPLDSLDPSAKRTELARQLPRLAGGSFRLLLCLPPTKVLRRTLTLPLAVEENLRQALTFELDRYTPFKPDQVDFDFRVLTRDVAQKRLMVELAVVRKTLVSAEVAQVAALGLPLSGAILAADALGDRQYFNFLPAATAAARPATRFWWRLGLGMLVLLALVALLAIPIWQKRSAAISLLTPLGQAKAAARQTDLLRDHLDHLVVEHNFLPKKKWDSPSAVMVLEELSKRLGDETYVAYLEFDGMTVQIQGESAASSSLIEALEASPLFKDVSFKAQLTKIQGTSNDRFHIVAALEDGAKPKPPAPESQPPLPAGGTGDGNEPTAPMAPSSLTPKAATAVPAGGKP